MTRVIEAKDARLQVRLDADAKERLQKAASYRRETVSEFVLTTALGEADRVISEHETITLSSSDWQLFMAALEDPPPPNDELRTAYRRYAAAKARG